MNESDQKTFIQNDILSKYSTNGITAGDIVYDFNNTNISYPSQIQAIPTTFAITFTPERDGQSFNLRVRVVCNNTGKEFTFTVNTPDVNKTEVKDISTDVLNLTNFGAAINRDDFKANFSYYNVTQGRAR